jgi:hypothetical protein
MAPTEAGSIMTVTIDAFPSTRRCGAVARSLVQPFDPEVPSGARSRQGSALRSGRLASVLLREAVISS